MLGFSRTDRIHLGYDRFRSPFSRNAHTIFPGAESGEVFVHRNVANLVVNTDTNAQTVITYAVEHLKVKHIIVCGHVGCGGVKLAMSNQDLGECNLWLREIRDVYRLHVDELRLIEDEEERYARLVELNVQEQCLNVIKTTCVQKSWGQGVRPGVHGLVFNTHTGEMKDLEIDFDALIEHVRLAHSLGYPPEHDESASDEPSKKKRKKTTPKKVEVSVGGMSFYAKNNPDNHSTKGHVVHAEDVA